MDPIFQKRILKQLGNIAILISIEGGEILTNKRRGENAYEKAMDTLHQLRKHGVIHGISTTITNQNYDYWLQEKHIDALIKQGIRIGVFIEHIPISKNKEEMQLLLSPTQRNQFRKHMLSVRENKKIYIVHSPGDEEFFGGCVSAGREFAHITPYGDITPCPISNIATHNLTTSSFIDAMKSPLFQSIRENEHLLETEGMPCALFAHPKEVDEIAKKVGAYRTNGK